MSKHHSLHGAHHHLMCSSLLVLPLCAGSEALWHELTCELPKLPVPMPDSKHPTQPLQGPPASQHLIVLDQALLFLQTPCAFSIMVMSSIFCHPLPPVLFLFPFFLSHKEAQEQLPQYEWEFGKLLPALGEEAVGEEGKMGRTRQRGKGWENLEAGKMIWVGVTLR